MNDPAQALRELCRQVREEAYQPKAKKAPISPSVREQARLIAAVILKRKKGKGERGPAISQYPHQATKLIAAEYAKFLGPDWYTGDDESVTIYGRCGEEILLDEASGTSIAELDGAWRENGSAGSREIWKMRLLQGYCQLLHIIIHLVQDVVG